MSSSTRWNQAEKVAARNQARGAHHGQNNKFMVRYSQDFCNGMFINIHTLAGPRQTIGKMCHAHRITIYQQTVTYSRVCFPWWTVFLRLHAVCVTHRPKRSGSVPPRDKDSSVWKTVGRAAIRERNIRNQVGLRLCICLLSLDASLYLICMRFKC